MASGITVYHLISKDKLDQLKNINRTLPSAVGDKSASKTVLDSGMGKKVDGSDMGVVDRVASSGNPGSDTSSSNSGVVSSNRLPNISSGDNVDAGVNLTKVEGGGDVGSLSMGRVTSTPSGIAGGINVLKADKEEALADTDEDDDDDEDVEMLTDEETGNTKVVQTMLGSRTKSLSQKRNKIEEDWIRL